MLNMDCIFCAIAEGRAPAEVVFEDEQTMAFMDINKGKLRELSLRMVLKIADLRKAFPSSWEAMAQTTCMKRH